MPKTKYYDTIIRWNFLSQSYLYLSILSPNQLILQLIDSTILGDQFMQTQVVSEWQSRGYGDEISKVYNRLFHDSTITEEEKKKTIAYYLENS